MEDGWMVAAWYRKRERVERDYTYVSGRQLKTLACYLYT